MDLFSILTLIGGLALFLYGMNAMGDGLAKVSGGKLDQATQMDVKSKMDDTCIIDFNEQEYEKSIVLIKYDDESFSKIHNAYINDCKATRERILGRKEVQVFLEENPDINTDSIKAICQQMDKNSLISECQCLNALGQIERMNEKRAELVLNKNTSIYPECIANEGDNPEDILEVNIS